MYGRESFGHSVTARTHQPAATTIAAAHPFVTAVGGSASVLDQAAVYLRISALGLPALLVLGSMLLLRGYRIDEAAVVAAGEVAR